MFSTCMFCDRALGSNEVLESFPVGRRLAFDSGRGRLWVVCRSCERWNLSPLDERWEAVEACERLFRDTRLRASSENIGLARHPEGLELVRIGSPVREEFAAWRYGDQFGRRRRKTLLYSAAGVVGVGAVVFGGIATGAISTAVLSQSGNLVNLWVNGRVRARIRTEDGRLLKLRNPDIRRTRLVTDGEGWGVSVKTRSRVDVFRGAEAERVAGLLMTRLNAAGGSEKRVREAVRQIERDGHPEAFLEKTLDRMERGVLAEGKGTLAKLPTETKLAFEMALHEERERRALEGELRGLEIIWRREEEVAAIADDLLVDEGTRSAFERLTSALRPGAPPAERTSGEKAS